MREPKWRMVWYWLPPLLWCAVIFIQSSFSAPDALPKWPHGDKLVHAVVYALLAVLFCRAFGSISGWRDHALKSTVFGVTAATLYGALDEWHQSFVVVRTADPMDLLADLCGALIGGILYSWIRSRHWGGLLR